MTATSILAVLTEHLSADELAHAAAAKRESERVPWLSSEAAEELATLLSDGEQPTIGWWKRHLPPVEPPPTPWPSRQDVVAAISGLLESGVPITQTATVMRAELQARGLPAKTAENWILEALG